MRLEKINPKSFRKLREYFAGKPAGTIFEDQERACFWIRDLDTICVIGVSGDNLNTLCGHVALIFTDERQLKLNRFLSDGTGLHHRPTHYGCWENSEFLRATRSILSKAAMSDEDKEDLKTLKNYITKGPKVPVKRTVQFGVELELESDKTISSDEKRDLAAKYKDLIQDIGSDCSVVGGTEVRFNHPSFRGWKLNTVKKFLDDAKAIGLKSEYGTAGMHIHVSHPQISKACEKFKNKINIMQSILYPINSRTIMCGKGEKTATTYGINDNIYHDQRSSFGTLEIRAWKATTDPQIFMRRIRIAKAIVEFLLTDIDVTAENFFKWLKPAYKADYEYLLDHENPHEFGMQPSTIKYLMAQ